MNEHPQEFDQRVAEGWRLRGAYIDKFIYVDNWLTSWLVELSGIPMDRLPALSRFFQRMAFPAKLDLFVDLVDLLGSENDLEQAKDLRRDLKEHNKLRTRLAHHLMVHTEDDQGSFHLFGQSGNAAAEEITFTQFNERWADLIQVFHRLVGFRLRWSIAADG